MRTAIHEGPSANMHALMHALEFSRLCTGGYVRGGASKSRQASPRARSLVWDEPCTRGRPASVMLAHREAMHARTRVDARRRA
eukprot:6212790-Pleurochrysis_carterae.AAC.1